MLLNEVLGWVRAQPGTASLRALVYMDEIFGFFPPVAEPAVQAAAADAAQAGPRLRRGHRAGHAEPGGPRLQGPGQRRHLVHRPAADRARQGPPARGAGRSGRGHRRRLRPAEDGGDPGRPRQPRLPDVQRARGRAGGLPDPLDPVVPARAAHPGADQDAHGPAAPGGGRGAGAAPAAAGRPPAATVPPPPPRWPAVAAPARRELPTRRRAERRAADLPAEIPQFYLPLRGSHPGERTLVYKPGVLGRGHGQLRRARHRGQHLHRRSAGWRRRRRARWPSTGTPPRRWSRSSRTSTASPTQERPSPRSRRPWRKLSSYRSWESGLLRAGPSAPRPWSCSRAPPTR